MMIETRRTSVAEMLDAALEHHRNKRPDEASDIYKNILALEPNHADCLHLLGMIAFEAGDCEGAIEQIRRAIESNPHAASYHLNLGNVLQHLGLAREAGTCYLRALVIKPGLVQAHVNLGHLFLLAENSERAIEWYRRAIALEPFLAEAHKKLGDSHRLQGDCDKAVEAYQRAIALRPGYADAHHELGVLLRARRDLDGALACFRQAVAAEPDHPRAAFAAALALLLQGNFDEGWAAYACRWSSSDHATPLRLYPQPAWDGGHINGKLLLWPEQGVGDEIMFAATLGDVVRSGTRCILECDPRLQPLFARSFPEIEVTSDHDAGFVEARGIAAQLPIGSLPLLYRRGRGAFPPSSAPYLFANPARREHFRSRYTGAGKSVGLSWHSNNAKTGRDRSMALAQLKPLFEASGLQWISLQYGERDLLQGQIDAAEVPLRLDPEVDQLADLDEFAAQVSAMDLVVTIDNTTAHLAGALGVPVWLMLPYAPDWRWPDAGTGRSPWYPIMRIFQQPAAGDWSFVIEQVREALVVL